MEGEEGDLIEVGLEVVGVRRAGPEVDREGEDAGD